MFRTIERTSGGGGGFLSDHPSPADRYARINQEAQSLTIGQRVRDTRQFERIQARLRSMTKAPTTEQIARSGQRYPVDNNDGRYPDNGDPRYPTNNDGRYPTNQPVGRVSAPSSRYQNYSAFGFLQVSVPNNWREVNDTQANSVWFAPEGAYGQLQGQSVFTHGINFVVAPAQGQNLQAAVDEELRNVQQSNANIRRLDRYNRVNVNGRNWISTRLTNTNEATGRPESIAFFATQLRNGNVLYIFTVAPQNESGVFQSAFNRIINSVQLND